MNQELIRLISAQVFLHAAMSALRLAAPLWALKEGYSAWDVSILLALFSLIQIFLALPVGRFVDRHGLWLPLCLSVVISCVGSALAAFFPFFAVLCLAAVCTGGATGAATIALQRHVGHSAKDSTQRKQVFSWLSLAPAISNFLGPFLAGFLIDSIGFRAAFALSAFLPLICWLLAHKVASQSSKEHRIQNQLELQSSDANSLQNQPRSSAWDLLKQTEFRRVLMINWFLSSCWDVHSFVVPILGHERGLNASVIGMILGGFAIAAAVMRLVIPYFAEDLREWQVLLIAMLSTAFLLFVYPFLPNAWLMGCCSALLGFSLGSVQPMIMSLLHHLTPTHRHGEALGLRLMTINASSVMMPLLFGSAGSVIGIKGVFLLCSFLIGSGSRLAWLMRPVIQK